MDKTEKNLLVLVLVLLLATVIVSSVPTPEVNIIPTVVQPGTAQVSHAPVIIKPGATASVIVVSNGAKAVVEVK